MEEIYKVVKLNHLKDCDYEAMLQLPTMEIVTLPIHEELVLKYRLVEGKELLTKQVESIYEQLDFGKVYQEALKILTRQAYTTADLKQKLESRNFELALIQETLKKLEEIGLLNDEQYAVSYIQHHALMGKKGPNMIKQELLRKGVLEQVIDQYLSNYKDEDQLDHVKKIMNQQVRLNKKYGPFLMKQKIYQSLLTKGFSSAIVEEAIADIEIETEEENPILLNQASKLFRKYEKLEEYERKNKLIQSLMRKGFSFDEVSKIYDDLKEEEA